MYKIPKKEELFAELSQLIARIKRDNSKEAAKKVIQIGILLAKEKAAGFISDLQKAYTNNMEQQLWKICFYNVIEVFRSANKEELQKYFLEFIDQAVKFYEELLKSYEDKFHLKLSDALYWKDFEPIQQDLLNLEGCASLKLSKFPDFENGKPKLVIRSAQRHFLAVGDLFRYKAMVTKEVKDYGASKTWYFKAAQANPTNGRSYNQLAVLAVHSRNYPDIVFYYVQALAAKYPFGSSRESLELAFNDLRKMAAFTEVALARHLNENKNAMNSKKPVKNITQKNRNGKQNIETMHKEVWIFPEQLKISEGNEIVKGLIEAKPDKGILEQVDGLRPTCDWICDSKMQEQAFAYLLHTVGILITNINMEVFEQASQIALQLLKALICADNSLASSSSVLKLTLISIFAVHHVKGTTPVMIETQKRYAFGFVVNILICLLDSLKSNFDYMELYLLTGKPSKKLERILPSISAICHWMTTTAVSEFIQNNDLVSLIADSFSWTEEVSKRLMQMNTLFKCSLDVESKQINQIGIFLPELVLSSSFYDIFQSTPKVIFVEAIAPTNQASLALHGRLYSIIMAGDALRNIGVGKSSGEANISVVKKSDKLNGNRPIGEEQGKVNEKEVDDHSIKQRMMNEEESSSQHKWVVEVRPQYLIPDTNTFVDHLSGLKKIVDSKLFTVLVPTTVIAELSSLSLDASSAHTFLSSEMIVGQNTQWKYVIKQAKATLVKVPLIIAIGTRSCILEYLKNAADERVRNLATITSNGNILPSVSFAYEMTDCGEKKTNDDRILSACIALSDKLPRSLETDYDRQTTKIKRNVVFLTEDRALSIKAIAAKIPVRTIPEFLKWARI